MPAGERLRKELEQCYIEFYRCMIDRDFISLSVILDDGFVLVHMTGMRQGKKDFIHAIEDGTLNYYSVHHENICLEVDGTHAKLVGDSCVTAAVFGGSRNTWRLRLQMQVINRNGKWFIGSTIASTY